MDGVQRPRTVKVHVSNAYLYYALKVFEKPSGSSSSSYLYYVPAHCRHWIYTYIHSIVSMTRVQTVQYLTPPYSSRIILSAYFPGNTYLHTRTLLRTASTRVHSRNYIQTRVRFGIYIYIRASIYKKRKRLFRSPVSLLNRYNNNNITTEL